jgi:hypothetical protein
MVKVILCDVTKLIVDWVMVGPNKNLGQSKGNE